MNEYYLFVKIVTNFRRVLSKNQYPNILLLKSKTGGLDKIMPEAFLTALAVCADAFAAALTYGIKNVQLGILQRSVIAVMGAVFLGVSLFASSAVQRLVSADVCALISAALLILISMKNLSSACEEPASPIMDLKNTKLGTASAAVVGLALSADSLGVGFGAGVTMDIKTKLSAVLFCLLFGLVFISVGLFLGSKLCKSLSRYHTALISSSVLFVLAIMKLT